MRAWTAIYYPHVEPPIAWLRSAALLFDNVTSFVPRESDQKLSDELLRFAEKTDAWHPYRPDEYTSELVDVSLDRLDGAFAQLAAERKTRAGHHEFSLIIDGATTRVEDRVFLHGTKMSEGVRRLLRKHGLLLPKALAEPFMPGDWWLVDEKASDLLLAQIADNLAARHGWASVTDNSDCHAFTAVDLVQDSARSAEQHLARLIISELIPDSIDQLSLEKYAELRLQYEPIREQVVRFVTEIIHEDRLNGIRDAEELRRAASAAVKALQKEVETFRESAIGAAVRKWSPFAIGGLLSLVAPALPASFGLSVSGAKLAISGVEKSGGLNPKQTKRGDFLRLLAAARDDILAGG
jgi:hypothetical protein